MSDDTAKSEHSQRRPGRSNAPQSKDDSEHKPGRSGEVQSRDDGKDGAHEKVQDHEKPANPDGGGHEDNPYQTKVSDLLGSLVDGLKARVAAFEEAVVHGATMADNDAQIVGNELMAEFDRLRAKFDELMGKFEGRT